MMVESEEEEEEDSEEDVNTAKNATAAFKPEEDDTDCDALIEDS